MVYFQGVKSGPTSRWASASASDSANRASATSCWVSRKRALRVEQVEERRLAFLEAEPRRGRRCAGRPTGSRPPAGPPVRRRSAGHGGPPRWPWSTRRGRVPPRRWTPGSRPAPVRSRRDSRFQSGTVNPTDTPVDALSSLVRPEEGDAEVRHAATGRHRQLGPLPLRLGARRLEAGVTSDQRRGDQVRRRIEAGARGRGASTSGTGSGSPASARTMRSAAAASRSAVATVRCWRSHSTVALMRSDSRASPSSARRVTRSRNARASSSAARATSSRARAAVRRANAARASADRSQRRVSALAWIAEAAASPTRFPAR